jgi:Protein of unknown function (DUF3102)
MSTTNATEEPTLLELATRIRVGHSAVIEGKKNIVRKAIEVGGWLNEAKAKVEHGEWLPWLKANCQISERTAQRYMHLADAKEPLEIVMSSKSATMADLTLEDAMELLRPSESKADPEDEAWKAIEDAAAKDAAADSNDTATPTARATATPTKKKVSTPTATVVIEPPDEKSDEDVGKEWLKTLAVDDLVTWLKEVQDDEYLRELAAALNKVLLAKIDPLQQRAAAAAAAATAAPAAASLRRPLTSN